MRSSKDEFDLRWSDETLDYFRSANVARLEPVPHRGAAVPYFSDLVHEWLTQKIGRHDIVFGASTIRAMYSVRIDGILIGWVSDANCSVELASGDLKVAGTKEIEVRRRRDTLLAADPLMFEKWWERIMLIDKDCVYTCGYSITNLK